MTTEEKKERQREATKRRAAKNQERIKEYRKKNYQENKNVLRAKTQDWRRRNPEQVRANAELANFRKFGITRAIYEELLSSQNGVCALCSGGATKGRGAANRRFHIEHEHSKELTKANIRGLLCHNCNIGLGNFLDNPEVLRKAAAYVEYFQNVRIS